MLAFPVLLEAFAFVLLLLLQKLWERVVLGLGMEWSRKVGREMEMGREERVVVREVSLDLRACLPDMWMECIAEQPFEFYGLLLGYLLWMGLFFPCLFSVQHQAKRKSNS